MPDRPPIPEDMKRRVRQRCGFGCVVCGIPLINYDHIMGYCKRRKHEEENICLLCDRHHREKTNGLLDLAAIRRANERPHNICSEAPSYPLHYSTRKLVTRVGSSEFHHSVPLKFPEFIVLMVDRQKVLSCTIEDDNVLLSAKFEDENKDTVLLIEKNELRILKDIWDLKFEGRKIVVRSAPRDIFLCVRFEVPDEIVFERLTVFCGGQKVELQGDEIRCGRDVQILRRFYAKDNYIGLYIDSNPTSIERAFMDRARVHAMRTEEEVGGKGGEKVSDGGGKVSGPFSA